MVKRYLLLLFQIKCELFFLKVSFVTVKSKTCSQGNRKRFGNEHDKYPQANNGIQ